jgi:uncharacterized protein YbaR (Trm112 family)
MTVEASLLGILACPVCHSALRQDAASGQPAGTHGAGTELVCTSPTCGLAYPVRDDIPVLLVDEARRPDAAGSGGTTG